jgi:hypothetical protein
MEDVDDEELEALGTDYDFGENRIFKRFFFGSAQERTAVRFHLAKHGIEDGSLSVEESLKAAKGTEVIAIVGLETYKAKNGDMVTQNTLTAFSSVED